METIWLCHPQRAPCNMRASLEAGRGPSCRCERRASLLSCCTSLCVSWKDESRPSLYHCCLFFVINISLRYLWMCSNKLKSTSSSLSKVLLTFVSVCLWSRKPTSRFSTQPGACARIKVLAFVLHLFPPEIISFWRWLVFGSFYALIPGASHSSLSFGSRRVWFDKTTAETSSVLACLPPLTRSLLQSQCRQHWELGN